MTEMRRRMEEELKLRGCSPRTRKAYLPGCADLLRTIGDRPSRWDLRRCVPT